MVVGAWDYKQSVIVVVGWLQTECASAIPVFGQWGAGRATTRGLRGEARRPGPARADHCGSDRRGAISADPRSKNSANLHDQCPGSWLSAQCPFPRRRGGTRCGAARAAMDGAIDSALRTKRHPAPRGSPRFVSSAAARGTATTHFFISRGSRGRNRGRSRRAQTLWFYKVGRGTPVGHELGDRDSFKTKKGESPSGKTRGRFTQNVCTAAAAAAALRWQRSKNKQGRCPQKRRHCGQKNETCTLSKVLPRGTAHSVSRSGGRRRPKAIWRDMQWLRGTDWDCECKSGCNALHGAPSAKGDTQKKEDRV